MKKILTGLSFILGFVMSVQSQKYEKALNQFSATHEIDKIYIQYDKDFYVPG